MENNFRNRSPQSYLTVDERLEGSPTIKEPTKIVKGLPLNEKLTFVPPKLIHFGVQSPKEQRNLPQISPRTITPKKEYSLLNRKYKKALVDSPEYESYFTERSHTDVANRASFANGVLSRDRMLTKMNVSNKKRDISYLMETRKYSNDKSTSHIAGDNTDRSLHLLSSDTSSSYLQKNMQNTMEAKATSNDKDNIYLQMKSFLKPMTVLPTDLGQIKSLLYTETTPSKRDISQSDLTSELPSLTFPKTIEAYKVGYGPDAYTEARDTEIKGGLEKVRSKKLIEHRAQNKHLLAPSGRKEVINLSEWLNNMLEKIANEKTMPVSAIFENVQLIYTVCLKEIIRQVKVQCLERGQLLDKIWDAYIDLLDRAINENNNDKVKMENQYLDEMKSLHNMYQKQLEFHIVNVENLKKETDEHVALSATRREQLRYVKKKNRKLNNELKRIKEEVEELKAHVEDAALENVELKTAITNAGINYGRRSSVVLNTLNLVNKKQVKKKEDKQDVFYDVFDTRKDFNLFENLNLIDKLEEELEGREFGGKDGFNDEDDFRDDEEELYLDAAVDTNDLNQNEEDDEETETEAEADIKIEPLKKDVQDKEVQCDQVVQEVHSLMELARESRKKIKENFKSESSLSSKLSHNEMVRRQKEEGIEEENILLEYFHEALANATGWSVPLGAFAEIRDEDLLCFFPEKQEKQTNEEKEQQIAARKKVIETLAGIFSGADKLLAGENYEIIYNILQTFTRALIRNSQMQYQLEEQEVHSKSYRCTLESFQNEMPDPVKQEA